MREVLLKQINSHDNKHYYTERSINFKVANNKLSINTCEGCYNDYSYEKQGYTGKYKLSSANGFFRIDLNKSDVESLIDFLNDIKGMLE